MTLSTIDFNVGSDRWWEKIKLISNPANDQDDFRNCNSPSAVSFKGVRDFHHNCSLAFFDQRDNVTKGVYFQVCCFTWMQTIFEISPSADRMTFGSPITPRILWNKLRHVHASGRKDNSSITNWILPQIEVDSNSHPYSYDDNISNAKYMVKLMNFWDELFCLSEGTFTSKSNQSCDEREYTRRSKRRRVCTLCRSQGFKDLVRGRYKLPAVYLLISLSIELRKANGITTNWIDVYNLAHKLPSIFRTFADNDVFAGLTLVGLTLITRGEPIIGLSTRDFLKQYLSPIGSYAPSVFLVFESVTNLDQFNLRAAIYDQLLSNIDREDNDWSEEYTCEIVDSCARSIDHQYQHLKQIVENDDKRHIQPRRKTWQNKSRPITNSCVPEEIKSPGFALLVHIQILLMKHDVKGAAEIVRMIDSSTSLSDDIKDTAWLNIWNYLLAEGKLFLDMNEAAPEYHERRDFLYSFMASRVSKQAADLMIIFYQEVANRVCLEESASLEEKQYVIFACQQTVLRLLLRIQGLGADTVHYFLNETNWPIAVPGTNAGGDLNDWCAHFLSQKRSIPPSLTDETTGLVHLHKRIGSTFSHREDDSRDELLEATNELPKHCMNELKNGEDGVIEKNSPEDIVHISDVSPVLCHGHCNGLQAKGSLEGRTGSDEQDQDDVVILDASSAEEDEVLVIEEEDGNEPVVEEEDVASAEDSHDEASFSGGYTSCNLNEDKEFHASDEEIVFEGACEIESDEGKKAYDVNISDGRCDEIGSLDDDDGKETSETEDPLTNQESLQSEDYSQNWRSESEESNIRKDVESILFHAGDADGGQKEMIQYDSDDSNLGKERSIVDFETNAQDKLVSQSEISRQGNDVRNIGHDDDGEPVSKALSDHCDNDVLEEVTELNDAMNQEISTHNMSIYLNLSSEVVGEEIVRKDGNEFEEKTNNDGILTDTNLQHSPKIGTEVAAVGGEFGDTTEEEDGNDTCKSNRFLRADHHVDDMNSGTGYASQVEDGYEPEDTHGYTEEEVSEAIHTEDEEDEQASKVKTRNLDSTDSDMAHVLAGECAVTIRKVDQQGSIEAPSDDMDMADERTEQEEDVAGEFSELEENPEGSSEMRRKPRESLTATTLLEFAQRAQMTPAHEGVVSNRKSIKNLEGCDSVDASSPPERSESKTTASSFDADDEKYATEGCKSLETDEEDYNGKPNALPSRRVLTTSNGDKDCDHNDDIDCVVRDEKQSVYLAEVEQPSVDKTDYLGQCEDRESSESNEYNVSDKKLAFTSKRASSTNASTDEKKNAQQGGIAQEIESDLIVATSNAMEQCKNTESSTAEENVDDNEALKCANRATGHKVDTERSRDRVDEAKAQPNRDNTNSFRGKRCDTSTRYSASVSGSEIEIENVAMTNINHDSSPSSDIHNGRYLKIEEETTDVQMFDNKLRRMTRKNGDDDKRSEELDGEFTKETCTNNEGLSKESLIDNDECKNTETTVLQRNLMGGSHQDATSTDGQGASMSAKNTMQHEGVFDQRSGVEDCGCVEANQNVDDFERHEVATEQNSSVEEMQSTKKNEEAESNETYRHNDSEFGTTKGSTSKGDENFEVERFLKEKEDVKCANDVLETVEVEEGPADQRHIDRLVKAEVALAEANQKNELTFESRPKLASNRAEVDSNSEFILCAPALPNSVHVESTEGTEDTEHNPKFAVGDIVIEEGAKATSNDEFEITSVNADGTFGLKNIRTRRKKRKGLKASEMTRVVQDLSNLPPIDEETSEIGSVVYQESKYLLDETPDIPEYIGGDINIKASPKLRRSKRQKKVDLPPRHPHEVSSKRRKKGPDRLDLENCDEGSVMSLKSNRSTLSATAKSAFHKVEEEKSEQNEFATVELEATYQVVKRSTRSGSRELTKRSKNIEEAQQNYDDNDDGMSIVSQRSTRSSCKQLSMLQNLNKSKGKESQDDNMDDNLSVASHRSTRSTRSRTRKDCGHQNLNTNKGKESQDDNKDDNLSVASHRSTRSTRSRTRKDCGHQNLNTNKGKESQDDNKDDNLSVASHRSTRSRTRKDCGHQNLNKNIGKESQNDNKDDNLSVASHRSTRSTRSRTRKESGCQNLNKNIGKESQDDNMDDNLSVASHRSTRSTRSRTRKDCGHQNLNKNKGKESQDDKKDDNISVASHRSTRSTRSRTRKESGCQNLNKNKGKESQDDKKDDNISVASHRSTRSSCRQFITRKEDTQGKNYDEVSLQTNMPSTNPRKGSNRRERTSGYESTDLLSWTVDRLRSELIARGEKPRSGLRKKELIDLLQLSFAK